MGIKLNVEAVLEQAERRSKEPKPAPQIKLGGKVMAKAKEKPPQKDQDIPDRYPTDNGILRDLWDKMTVVKKERAKLSSRSAHLVQELEHRLQATEGPTVAKAFMDGELPLPDLRDHYEKIQSFTDEAIVLYDKIRHVEKYGQLPAEPESDALINMDSTDISMMQLEMERLRDLVCKTKKKIALGKAKNPLRINEWHEKLALAEARREDLRLKVKKLQYDARSKRAD